MPGRIYASNTYRYGFNGSEKDDEITGVGQASFTTLFREGDTRLGKWWTRDPKSVSTPWESAYVLMGDNPIINRDVLGDKWKNANDKTVGDNLSKQYANKEKKFDKDITNFTEKFNKAVTENNSADIDKYQEKLEEAMSGKADMQRGQKEIAAMEADANITFTFNDLGTYKGKEANLEWGGDWSNPGGEKLITINYYGTNSEGFWQYGNLSHEARHGAQVLEGYQYPALETGNAQIFRMNSSYQNERESYTRQYFMDPYSLPISTTTIKDFRDINRDYILNMKNGVGEQIYNFPASDYGELRKWMGGPYR